MIDPVIAGIPPSAMLVLLLICTIIAGVGALVLRQLQTRRKDETTSRFPLNGFTLILGPLIGLVLGAVSNSNAPDDWGPVDLRRQFEIIMILSSGAGCLAALVVLLIVDLPRRGRYRHGRHGRESEFETSEVDDHV